MRSSGTKKTNPAVNIYLIKQMEAEGREVKKIVKNSRLLQATVINPIKRLHDKGILTKQEYFAGIGYGNWFELSNLSHHSRPMYDGSSPAKGGKPTQKTLPQSQLDASKKVREVKLAVEELGLKEKEDYPGILAVIFEQQKSFHYAELKLKMCHKTLEQRVKLICETLLDI